MRAEEQMGRCTLVDCKSTEEILPITVMQDSNPFFVVGTQYMCKQHRNTYVTSGWAGIKEAICDLDPEWAKGLRKTGF